MLVLLKAKLQIHVMVFEKMAIQARKRYLRIYKQLCEWFASKVWLKRVCCLMWNLCKRALMPQLAKKVQLESDDAWAWRLSDYYLPIIEFRPQNRLWNLGYFSCSCNLQFFKFAPTLQKCKKVCLRLRLSKKSRPI